MLSRYPMKYHDVDIGSYLEITNNLNYSISNQVFNFLVKPVSGDTYYITSGAEVVSTVNGSDAFLIQVNVDLDAAESSIIRIYPNNAEAPSLDSIEYPERVTIGEEYVVNATMTNPSSGILGVYLDVIFDEISIGRYEMTSFDGTKWSASLVHNVTGEYHLQIRASDYSGLEFTSSLFSLDCSEVEQPQDLVPILTLTFGSVVVVIVALYVMRRVRAP